MGLVLVNMSPLGVAYNILQQGTTYPMEDCLGWKMIIIILIIAVFELYATGYHSARKFCVIFNFAIIASW